MNSSRERAAPAATDDRGNPRFDRPDWREGRIESSSVPLFRACVFAILWNLLTWLSVYSLWRQITDDGRIPLLPAVRANPLVFVLLIFVVIALGSAVSAVRRAARAVRYPRSVLTMQSVPAVVGGELEGIIRVPGLRLRADQGIRATLRCRVTESRALHPGGYGTRVSEFVEWEDDQVVPPGEVTDLGRDTLVPVRLSIPSFCRETAETVEVSGRCDTFAWWLEARAEPRHGWRAAFEVPVFRTPASPPPPERPVAFRRLSLAERWRLADEFGTRGKEPASKPVSRPVTSRIVVHAPAPDGTRIDFPPGAFFAISAWWLVTLPLYVVLPLDLFHLQLLGPVASLVLVLLINGLPGFRYVWSRPRALLIGPQWITLSCGLPFFGTRWRMPTEQAAGRVQPDTPRIAILRKDADPRYPAFFVGRLRNLSHAEARWLGSEIERALAVYR